jgi:hypothetical protein
MLTILLVFFVSSSYAQCAFNLGNTRFDFSDLIGQDIKYEIGEASYFRVSVCTNLLDPCINGFSATGPQFGSLYAYMGSMCRPLSRWNPMSMLIAPLSPAVASVAEFGTGVTIFFQNGPTCSNGKPTRTQYNMICDTGSDTGNVVVRAVNACSYVVNWPTKHACAYVGPNVAPVHFAPPSFPKAPVPQEPLPMPVSSNVPKQVTPVVPKDSTAFVGDFKGNATCSNPKLHCFNGVTKMKIQLECKSCQTCALVMFADEVFYSSDIKADVCKENVLSGTISSNQGLTGYVYLHAYNEKRFVKGTLDIDPFMSSKWDLELEVKTPQKKEKTGKVPQLGTTGRLLY